MTRDLEMLIGNFLASVSENDLSYVASKVHDLCCFRTCIVMCCICKLTLHLLNHHITALRHALDYSERRLPLS